MYFTRSMKKVLDEDKIHLDNNFKKIVKSLVLSYPKKICSSDELTDYITKFKKFLYITIDYKYSKVIVNEVIYFCEFILNNYTYLTKESLDIVINCLKKYDSSEVKNYLYEFALLKVFM